MARAKRTAQEPGRPSFLLGMMRFCGEPVDVSDAWHAGGCVSRAAKNKRPP